MKRVVLSTALALGLSVSAAAQPLTASDAGTPLATSNGGPSFRLEGQSAIDDVFGDSSDYRRTIDRFADLSANMQQLRDEFARSVQAALVLVRARAANPKPIKKGCPVDELALPYAKARRSGAGYLRVGRELTRHYDQIKEYDRLGETIGLTPDYRWKVRKVLLEYHALLTDYREMKVAFHDQLDDELRYMGCDLNALLQKGDPRAAAQLMAQESWPQPGQVNAPGSPTKLDVSAAPPGPGPGNITGGGPIERIEQQPIVLPILPGRPAGVEQTRSGILFYVDNTHCGRSARVFVDSKKAGEVKGHTRLGLQTSLGPHDLCVLDDPKKQCGQAGTVRKSYLSEGWTISLRCD